MENLIDKLIGLNVEIEGLLLVLKERQSETAMAVLKEKYNEYQNLADELTQTQSDQNLTPSQQLAREVARPDIAPVEDIVNLDEAVEHIDSEPDAPQELNDLDLAFEKSIEHAIEQEGTEIRDAIAQDIADGNADAAEEIEDEVQDEPEDEMSDEAAVEEELDEAAVEEELDEAQDEESQDEIIDEAPEVAEEEPVQPAEVITEEDAEETLLIDRQPDARDESIRVDELLSRREARDLKRAFTLNDKFRFRRELFGHNDQLFASTLNTLQDMDCFEEAESYLYEYLGLDRDNEDVKDFAAIIRNHFASI